MGSRAQILMKDEGVYLYTHWGADTLVSDLRDILSSSEANSRKDDPEYLARIIFSQMIKNDINGSTGYGIGGSQHGDIELLITISCDPQYIDVLRIYEDKEYHYNSFRDFIDGMNE